MGIDLFAVQPFMTLEDYADEHAFSAHMARLMQTTVARRRHDHALVVFPEDLATFLALVGAPDRAREATTLNTALSAMGRARAGALLGRMLTVRSVRLPVAFFHLVAPTVYGAWYRTMSRLAREYGLTVVAGSALLPENRLGYASDRFESAGTPVFNLALSFNSEGKVASVSKKRNLVPTQEDRLALTRGPKTPPPPIPVGDHQVGVAICYDAFVVPHTGTEPDFDPLVSKLARMGADIIAQPSANPWPWREPWVFQQGSDHRSRQQQWRQEGLLEAMHREPAIRAGVNPQLLATLFDTHFDGQSAIYVREGHTVLPVVEAAQGDARPEAETVIGWSLPF